MSKPSGAFKVLFQLFNRSQEKTEHKPEPPPEIQPEVRTSEEIAGAALAPDFIPASQASFGQRFRHELLIADLQERFARDWEKYLAAAVIYGLAVLAWYKLK
jgi:hypothetical protein